MADGDELEARPPDRSAVPVAGSPAWLVDPAALLPLAVLAVVLVGGLHLLVDLIAFTGGFVDQFGGILTDATTILAGIALAVAFTALTRAELPERLASWSVLGWVGRVRAEPARLLRGLVIAFVTVAAAHALVAFLDRADGGGLMPALRLLTHDLAFLLTIVGVVVALAAIAVDRAGERDWPDAGMVRDLVTLALYAGPTLAVLSALLTLIDEAGDHARAAFMIATFLVIEAAAAAAILLLAVGIVRARHPAAEGETERVPLRGLVAGAVASPVRFISPLIGVAAGVGVLHILLATAEQGEYSNRLGFVGFSNSLFDVVALVMVVVLVRAVAATPSTLGLDDQRVDGSPDDEDASALDRTVGRTIYVVAYLGVFSALVSAWAFRGLGSEVWYWFFNRLVRTAIVLAALLGVAAMRKEHGTTGS